MKTFNPKAAPKATTTLAAVFLAVLVGACSNVPQDSRYQYTGRGGGWENFRAEAPTNAPTNAWLA